MLRGPDTKDNSSWGFSFTFEFAGPKKIKNKKKFLNHISNHNLAHLLPSFSHVLFS